VFQIFLPIPSLFFLGFLLFRPTLTAKDIDDIQNWAVKHNVDFIAASFVRKASDVEKIREVLGPSGAHIKIICKIENLEGLQNYSEILKATDGIMVVRNNLLAVDWIILKLYFWLIPLSCYGIHLPHH
jgi:pyruvate kinase